MKKKFNRTLGVLSVAIAMCMILSAAPGGGDIA